MAKPLELLEPFGTLVTPVTPVTPVTLVTLCSYDPNRVISGGFGGAGALLGLGATGLLKIVLAI